MTPSSPSESDTALLETLNQNHVLKSRVMSILNMAANQSGEFNTAAEAELGAIEEMRKLGQELLQTWADNRLDQSVNQLKFNHTHLIGNGKKRS